MLKYNSFNDYLQDKYHKEIGISILNFAKKNGIRTSDGEFKIYKSYKLVAIKVYRIQFTASEFSSLAFNFFVKGLFIINGTLRRLDTYIGSMRGSFEEGFKFDNKSEIQTTDENTEGVFTDALVPVMQKDEYDVYATRFLKHFYPEALLSPTRLDISKLAKDHGLEYHFAPIGDDVLGVIYFANDRAKIFIDKDSNESVIEVHPGTVLINADKAFERGSGSTRNTFIHEAVHWYFHRNYFELQQALDNSLTKTVCYRGKNYDANKDIEWMEQQARALTPRILMPKEQFLIKYREIKNEVENKEDKNDQIKIKTKIVKALASFFGVSKESAKYRLIDLGFTDYSGVYNYSEPNDTYLHSFSYKNNFLKDHQTFVLNEQSYSRLLETNESIRNAVLNFKFIYTNGMLVVNNPKYIKNNLELTEYARNHVDECCLVFTLYSDFESSVKSNDKCFFMYSTTNNKKLTAAIDDNQLKALVKLVDENNKHYLAHKGKLPSNFSETLKYHMKKCCFNQQDLSYESDVNEKYISYYVNNKRLPTENEIIKMGLAMRLSYPYITDLLLKADKPAIPSYGTDNSTLLALIMSRGRRNIEETYVFLKEIGRENLLNLSSKYISDKKL